MNFALSKTRNNPSGMNNINIYVILGDSHNGVPLSPAIDPEPVGYDTKYQFATRTLIYYKTDRTSTANGSWQLYRTRETGGNPITRMPGEIVDGTNGPFEASIDQNLVYTLDNSSIKKAIAILKVAKGGSMLINRTSSDNDWVKTNGELYTAAADYFWKVALPGLYTLGYKNVTIKAFFVSLGTNDAATARWVQATFLAAVPAFCMSIRADYGALPDTPIFWGQVRSDLASVTGFDATTVGQCRTILTNCKSGGSTAITGFNLYETTEWLTGATIDGVHHTPDSNIIAGAEVANLLIALGE